MAQTTEHIISKAIVHYQPGISVGDLCRAIDLDEVIFYEYFESTDDLWADSYVVFLDAALDAMKSLPGVEDSVLQERLATLVFILLDVFEENQAYVDQTFRSYASGFRSPFQAALRSELAHVIDSPDVPGVNQVIFGYSASLFVLSESIVQLLNVWLSDESVQRDRSSALFDRFISFWAEIISSGVPQRTIDLIRYSVEADYLPIKNIPIIKNWFRSDEPKSDTT